MSVWVLVFAMYGYQKASAITIETGSLTECRRIEAAMTEFTKKTVLRKDASICIEVKK